MPQLKFDLEKENENLNIFLFELTDLQEAFVEYALTLGYSLDYTLDSLDELERYCLEQHVTFDDPSDAALVQRTNCWTYLAEVVRKNYGGGWLFSANEENTMNWGLYVITGHCPVEGVEFEPLGLLQGFLLRPEAGALRDAVLAHVDPFASEVDFSDLEEDE